MVQDVRSLVHTAVTSERAMNLHLNWLLRIIVFEDSLTVRVLSSFDHDASKRLEGRLGDRCIILVQHGVAVGLLHHICSPFGSKLISARRAAHILMVALHGRSLSKSLSFLLVIAAQV